MIIYKFGGASVQNAAGVENLKSILEGVSSHERLIVVISAMGKITNALERLLGAVLSSDEALKRKELTFIEDYHINICKDLNIEDFSVFKSLFFELEDVLLKFEGQSYDKMYDKIVSFGEMFSTSIISQFLSLNNVDNTLIDMRKVCVTDEKHREANVNFDLTSEKLQDVINSSENRVFIAQGFIGASQSGEITTLGREGSDYTAAFVANLLDAESVTIWKDVEGVLNADPRLFDDVKLIKEMSYIDAVELAYSGANVIHPKTIKPLENKKITLYVRSFIDKEKEGSVICETNKRVDLPIYIVKSNQVLISINPRDFSFVLEESLPHIFTILNDFRQKVSLMQSSAIKVSVCVDDSPYFGDLISELKKKYKIRYNKGLELVTVRGEFTKQHIDELKKDKTVFVEQDTRRSCKILSMNKLS